MRSYKVPLFRLTSLSHLQNIFHVLPLTFSSACDGLPLQTLIHCFLAYDLEFLYFGGSAVGTPWFDPLWRNGDFIEGLWNWDVVELFIKDHTSSTYQEFNISPCGAWWACEFVSHRKRGTKNYNYQGVELFSSVTQENWKVAIAIPLNSVKADFQCPQSLRLNISGIVGKKRQHFSWASMDTKQPDFHKSETFVSVRVIDL